MGSALLPRTYPRVLLIDEIDKSDIDLPNDLLNIFEEGCRAFPFVVLTSNGERDFPPPFLRRCLRLHIQEASEEKLVQIIQAHFEPQTSQVREKLIQAFLRQPEKVTHPENGPHPLTFWG
jgi:MoxR-like ATPase